MIKRFIVIILAIVFVLTMLTGCGNDYLENPVAQDDFESSGTQPVQIDDAGIDFIVNGSSEYKIVIEDESLDRLVKAVKDMSNYINDATGAHIPVVTESTISSYSDSDKYIVFGCPSIQEKAGLEPLTEDVSSTGYKILQKDNSVFVQAEYVFGYSNAAYTILEHQIGWKIYTKDIITYNKTKDVKLKAFNLTEKPDIEFPNNTNKLDIDTARRMKMVRQWDMFANVDGEMCHTFLKLLPTGTYNNSSQSATYHPDWYNATATQICTTAHGKADEYAALVDEMADRVILYLNKSPYAKAIIVGQMDAQLECGCEACNAERAKYGTVSGAYVKFVNSVSDKVVEKFAEQNVERTVDILFFAYQDSVAAPVVKDANGNYVPVDESVVCRENVAVYYAPMYADYTVSFYDDANAAYRDEIEKWKACTNKMYTFLYGTYYWNYLLPFNNYYSMTENAEYFLEQGAVNYFSLGQSEPDISSTFNSLKDYIETKILWDTSLSYKDITVDFFKGVYGPAAYDMYLFFDSMTTWLEVQAEKFDNIKNVWGDIDNKDSNIWRYGVLKEWEGMIEKSFAALEPLKETDLTLYSKCYDKIDLEYLSIKYAYIEFCPTYFNEGELLDLKYSFKNTATRLGVSYSNEGGALDTRYTAWGIA